MSPQLEEFVSCLEICVPRAERLHREISVAPGLGDKIVVQACHHFFKVGGNNNNTLDTLFKLVTSNSHDVEKDVVALDFLNQHDSERTFILGQLVFESFNVNRVRHTLLDGGYDVENLLFR